VPIDDIRWYNALRGIHATVSSDEAGAIIDVARLAARADGKTTVDELAVIVMLRRIVTEMAGGDMPHPVPLVDASRRDAIAKALTATGPRELAYACAMIVMMHDLELTAEERDLATELANALVIEPARAKAISAQMGTLVVADSHGAAVAQTGATVSGTADTVVMHTDKPRR
jgi:tellurite resistance protein